jgi:hypothetical protein
MKRTILLFMLAFFAITLVSAQGNDRRKPGFSPGGPRQHQPQHQGKRGYDRNFFQYQRDRGFNQNNAPRPESVSVSGNLSISRGMIAITSGDTTYLVSGLNRYIGFIDGLKEGASVKLEGYARRSPQDEKVKFLQTQKMTLNGKEYDLAWSRQGPTHYPMPVPRNRK